ncbi:MAG: MMPL family transporter [Desulfuromonadaceae bacterium]|nr:MMPL family transporter [Desulfuromonadaceae bacterium]
MAVGSGKTEEMPVVTDPKDFDSKSGNLLERLIFNNRMVVMVACVLVTLLLAYQTTKTVFNASFEKMLPQSHPYIKNYLANKKDLPGLGNSIRVVVENTQGDIFDPQYLDVLRQINDDLVLTTGVDRAWVKSIWTPAVRWNEVTEEGFQGGPVMPDNFDGSPEKVAQLKQNIARSGIVGSLLGTNYKSALVFVPLLDNDPNTGKRLDYSAFSKKIEESIRKKYEATAATDGKGTAQANGKIKIHIVGFAKMVGDLIDGLMQVMTYFGIAALIATIVIFLYTRCIRSTVLVILCSVVAVIWQLGIVATFGYELDPYSILVPFLVFAIGVSHGVQKMNGIMQDVGRGTHKQIAARYTFRRLFVAGLTALMADAVGFAVLMMIDIPVIKDLAITASIGVAGLIVTNLLLLPVFLSFTGVSAKAARQSLQEETDESKGKGAGAIWSLLDHFTERRWATRALLISAVLAVAGFIVSLNLKIGDLDPGAPELRPNSRYNKDNSYITSNYSLSSDQFAVILKTPIEGAIKYEPLIEADRLAFALRQVPGVQATVTLGDSIRMVTAGTYDGNPKWYTLNRSQQVLNYGGQQSCFDNPEMINSTISVTPVIAYLTDHKAETLTRVLTVAEEFVTKHSTKDRQFLLAAGSSGIEAATNIVVKEANRTMLLYVYGAVIILCFITFRSWRAVVVAVLPLILTSILCEALMVVLGIGVKVATLPVIALGVGIGIDYALYLLSMQLKYQREGLPLGEAYKKAVQFTGKVVALVGITLAGGVITWSLSPIKFQADMGILLTFMFLWNMVGALVLIPALSHFLLKDVHETVEETAEEKVPAKTGIVQIAVTEE